MDRDHDADGGEGSGLNDAPLITGGSDYGEVFTLSDDESGTIYVAPSSGTTMYDAPSHDLSTDGAHGSSAPSPPQPVADIETALAELKDRFANLQSEMNVLEEDDREFADVNGLAAAVASETTLQPLLDGHSEEDSLAAALSRPFAPTTTTNTHTSPSDRNERKTGEGQSLLAERQSLLGSASGRASGGYGTLSSDQGTTDSGGTNAEGGLDRSSPVYGSTLDASDDGTRWDDGTRYSVAGHGGRVYVESTDPFDALRIRELQEAERLVSSPSTDAVNSSSSTSDGDSQPTESSVAHSSHHTSPHHTSPHHTASDTHTSQSHQAAVDRPVTVEVEYRRETRPQWVVYLRPMTQAVYLDTLHDMVERTAIAGGHQTADSGDPHGLWATLQRVHRNLAKVCSCDCHRSNQRSGCQCRHVCGFQVAHVIDAALYAVTSVSRKLVDGDGQTPASVVGCRLLLDSLLRQRHLHTRSATTSVNGHRVEGTAGQSAYLVWEPRPPLQMPFPPPLVPLPQEEDGQGEGSGRGYVPAIPGGGSQHIRWLDPLPSSQDEAMHSPTAQAQAAARTVSPSFSASPAHSAQSSLAPTLGRGGQITMPALPSYVSALLGSVVARERAIRWQFEWARSASHSSQLSVRIPGLMGRTLQEGGLEHGSDSPEELVNYVVTRAKQHPRQSPRSQQPQQQEQQQEEKQTQQEQEQQQQQEQQLQEQAQATQVSAAADRWIRFLRLLDLLDRFRGEPADGWRVQQAGTPVSVQSITSTSLLQYRRELHNLRLLIVRLSSARDLASTTPPHKAPVGGAGEWRSIVGEHFFVGGSGDEAKAAVAVPAAGGGGGAAGHAAQTTHSQSTPPPDTSPAPSNATAHAGDAVTASTDTEPAVTGALQVAPSPSAPQDGMRDHPVSREDAGGDSSPQRPPSTTSPAPAATSDVSPVSAVAPDAATRHHSGTQVATRHHSGTQVAADSQHSDGPERAPPSQLSTRTGPGAIFQVSYPCGCCVDGPAPVVCQLHHAGPGMIIATTTNTAASTTTSTTGATTSTTFNAPAATVGTYPAVNVHVGGMFGWPASGWYGYPVQQAWAHSHHVPTHASGGVAPVMGPPMHQQAPAAQGFPGMMPGGYQMPIHPHNPSLGLPVQRTTGTAVAPAHAPSSELTRILRDLRALRARLVTNTEDIRGSPSTSDGLDRRTDPATELQTASTSAPCWATADGPSPVSQRTGSGMCAQQTGMQHAGAPVQQTGLQPTRGNGGRAVPVGPALRTQGRPVPRATVDRNHPGVVFLPDPQLNQTPNCRCGSCLGGEGARHVRCRQLHNLSRVPLPPNCLSGSAVRCDTAAPLNTANNASSGVTAGSGQRTSGVQRSPTRAGVRSRGSAFAPSEQWWPAGSDHDSQGVVPDGSHAPIPTTSQAGVLQHNINASHTSPTHTTNTLVGGHAAAVSSEVTVRRAMRWDIPAGSPARTGPSDDPTPSASPAAASSTSSVLRGNSKKPWGWQANPGQEDQRRQAGDAWQNALRTPPAEHKSPPSHRRRRAPPPQQLTYQVTREGPVARASRQQEETGVNPLTPASGPAAGKRPATAQPGAKDQPDGQSGGRRQARLRYAREGRARRLARLGSYPDYALWYRLEAQRQGAAPLMRRAGHKGCAHHTSSSPGQPTFTTRPKDIKLGHFFSPFSPCKTWPPVLGVQLRDTFPRGMGVLVVRGPAGDGRKSDEEEAKNTAGQQDTTPSEEHKATSLGDEDNQSSRSSSGTLSPARRSSPGASLTPGSQDNKITSPTRRSPSQPRAHISQVTAVFQRVSGAAVARQARSPVRSTLAQHAPGCPAQCSSSTGPDCSGESSSLRRGDVVIEVNRVPVHTLAGFRHVWGSLKPSSRFGTRDAQGRFVPAAVLTVMREGGMLYFRVS